MLEEIFRWFQTEIATFVTVGAIIIGLVLISSGYTAIEHYITSLYNKGDE
jgi:hypothetical protein